MNLFAVFLQTLTITLPVFAMVFLGIGLRRLGWIDATFISTASALVFKGTLPTLMFLSIIQADLDTTLNPWLLVYFAVATLGTYALSWGWAAWRVDRDDRSAYVQGAFRANCGIIGLALAASLYGEAGLSIGGLLLIVVTLCYNPLAVLVLASYQPERRASVKTILIELAKNPLIMAAVLALLVVWSRLQLPEWLLASGHYFGSMTLPLALICTGGTLSLSALRQQGSAMVGASVMKMVVLPGLATLGAWLLGFSGRELGVLLVFFASPTAVSSFVMAKAMGGNAHLSANIIAMTTLMAVVTITLGVFVLRTQGII